MPVFRVEFVRRIETDIEAESIDEARAAADATVEDGFDGWMMEDWEVDSVYEVSGIEPDGGIRKDNTIGHISDAVPISERERLVCEHGNEVDLLGRGCEECDAAGQKESDAELNWNGDLR